MSVRAFPLPLSSNPWTAPLDRRLNSRKRFRTKLAKVVETGVMITISRFSPDLRPGDDGIGIMTNSVPSIDDRNTPAIPSQKVSPCNFFFFLRLDGKVLAHRISAKSRMSTIPSPSEL